MTLARTLAAAARDLSLHDVPGDVKNAACRHLLDGVGTALAAIRTDAALPALRVTQRLDNASRGRLFGASGDSSHTVAFGMAAAVHALDFDDTHARALIHPTSVVLPAVMAVGREIGSSGADVLEAAITGYEVGCRLGAASPFGFHAAGVHATSAVGVVAAAAAAAKLLALPVAEFSNALSIAASVAGGLLESLGTGTKQLHPAFAVSNGILAVRLAAAGADGSASALEGEKGLFATHSRRHTDPHSVTDGFGTRWEVKQISLKPYPCCHLMHSSLDAAAKVRVAVDVGTTEITRVDVRAHADSLAIVGKSKVPRDPNDARFSLAWTVAAMLIDGVVTIDTFTPEMLGREDIAALASSVTTDSLPSLRVAASSGAVVTVTSVGRSFEASVPCSKGTPELPLSTEDLRGKFYANCGGASKPAVEAAERLLNLADQDGMDRLAALTEDVLAT
ncbi:MmgE/PrpD family protein [Mycolicibacterium iranicum]|uniref:MmgE/PrpD family protein n=1 Tax=Mycolicibacterium iranicum TaxID=912594 RepID=UPI00046454AF|nr:MmgE/PrpD family protein [Mycolicibacterium iranicum]